MMGKSCRAHAFWLSVLIGGALSVSIRADTMAPTKSAVDEVLRSPVAEHKIPGIVATATNAEGVTYQGAFGTRSDSPLTSMTMDTIFGIASMTKPVTTVAVMQLAELGKVKLDEPARTYLPVIGKAPVIDYIDIRTGNVVMRLPKAPVTARELLSQTSGFGYDLWDGSCMTIEPRYWRMIMRREYW